MTRVQTCALPISTPLACFIIPLGDEYGTQALNIAAKLRDEGFRVDLAFGNRSLKGAMKAADKSGAQFAFVLGERESQGNSVELKELSSGQVQSVKLEQLASVLGASAGISQPKADSTVKSKGA